MTSRGDATPSSGSPRFPQNLVQLVDDDESTQRTEFRNPIEANRPKLCVARTSELRLPRCGEVHT